VATVGDSRVLYGWRQEHVAAQHNLTCIVDARPPAHLYWTHPHRRHHQHHPQQLHSNDTFHVFRLNSSATVLQVDNLNFTY